MLTPTTVTGVSPTLEDKTNSSNRRASADLLKTGGAVFEVEHDDVGTPGMKRVQHGSVACSKWDLGQVISEHGAPVQVTKTQFG